MSDFLSIEYLGYIFALFFILLFIFLTTKVFSLNKKDIDNMSGLDFEQYVAKILKNNGYKITLTKSSHDFGADIIVKNLGQNNKKAVIQLKRYSGAIPIGAVQEVFSAMYYYDADISIVLTNNYFSPSACQLADKIGVLLWDRKYLLNIIKGQRLEKYLADYL